MKARSRFRSIAPDPDSVRPLSLDNPAVVEGRTIYPGTVVSAENSPRLLVSGQNSRKLGHMVTKGKWKGFPIYQLTLEERATCPRSCFHWVTCFGNGMNWARRHSHKGRFLEFLAAELADLQERHPDGFAVRLHVLGDFFSVAYVNAWRNWLKAFPALHVFGFTAWQPDTEIGAAVRRTATLQWGRFAIRTSDALTGPRSLTIWRKPEANVVKEGVICPAELNEGRVCGNCSLCWAAPDKAVVFVAHGTSRGRKPGTSSVDVAARNRAIIDTWNEGHQGVEAIAGDFGIGTSTAATVIADAQKTGEARRRRA